MRTIIRRNSFSPALRAEIAELGLPRARPAFGPALLLSVLMIDVAAAVVSLVAQ